MRYKITSPRVFIDTLESFFDEHGGYKSYIVNAFSDYMKTDYEDYVGSFTDACNIRDILNDYYDLNLPPLDAIQWSQYVNHNASYLGES